VFRPPIEERAESPHLLDHSSIVSAGRQSDD
jgi:hypothetical protein